jgi:RNA polymerase sigma-70 factor (ECF subfamily)
VTAHERNANQRVEHLYRTHGARVLGYLARRVDPTEDAADLLSEVMLVTWRRRHDLPASPEDLPWVFGVARNVLANHRRSTTRRLAATEDLAAHLRLLPLSDGQHREAGMDLRAALARLDDLDREIVTLSVWEQLSSAEIAVVLTMPAATVRSRLARARARLRTSLDEEVDRTEPCHEPSRMPGQLVT